MKSIKIGYQHDIIKQYKKIKSGSKEYQNVFVLEGIWAYEKIIETTTKINTVIYCQSLIKSQLEQRVLNYFIEQSELVYEVSEKTIHKMNSKDITAMVLICENKSTQSKISKSLSKIIVLDGLENPGNIGTIFRSSDGAGFDAVFVVNQKATINQYKIVKASMGGYLNIPWYNFDSIEECVTTISKHQLKLILANPNDECKNLHHDNFALVVGNERYGLSKEWFGYNHRCVSIPMYGCCDSLNVGVAASILMYKIGVQ